VIYTYEERSWLTSHLAIIKDRLSDDGGYQVEIIEGIMEKLIAESRVIKQYSRSIES